MSALGISLGLDSLASHRHPDDIMLVQAAKSGQELAFAELFQRHSAKVLRATSKIMKNRQDAEDAMQDAFLRAFAHIGQFDGRSQFSTWLTRIAINSSLMTLRRRRLHPETSIESLLEINTRSWEPTDASISAEMHCLKYEQTACLERAIRRLPLRLRVVLEIQQMRGCSVIETAQIAEISLPAAKSRLLRARRILQRTMK